MILWMILAFMTAIAVLVVLVPLARQRDSSDVGEASDVAVYRDQLSELKHDFERGVLGETEVEAARTEIARRLLKAADTQSDTSGQQDRPSKLLRRLTQGFALACIPGLSLGIYLFTGKPELPSQPFAERPAVEVPKSVAQEDTTLVLIARAEDHLSKNPDDIRGWKILAPVYGRLRRFSDASFALKNVMRLSGNSPKATADYGESLIIGNRGEVSPQALEIFNTLLKTNPNMPRPLHYIALAEAQAGRLKIAATKWRALLASNPQDAPWRGDIERLAAKAEGKEVPKISLSALPAFKGNTTTSPRNNQLPALSKEQLNAANSMDAASHQQMIAGMVKRLSDRLAKNGGTVSEWVQLARTQKVLGKTQLSRQALTSAEAAYADKPEALAQIKTARTQLGLGGGNATAKSAPSQPQASKLPALSAEQMQAAGSMDATSRQQMIAGMVKRLSDRLNENGGDVSEWIKLARTQKVLGNMAGAKAALAKGEAAHAEDAAAVEQIKAARVQLGFNP